MPTRPPRACACPGCATCNGRCAELVRAGRCTRCTATRQADAPHDKARKKIYDSARWKALRRTVQHDDPWCAWPGCSRIWTQLDHEPPLIEVLAQGGDPYARDGVQGLCASHHAVKTLAELRARRSRA